MTNGPNSKPHLGGSVTPPSNGDAILFSGPADRNKAPLLTVLQALLPTQGSVLEIASGTGQHVEWSASHCPQITWHPSDPAADCRASVNARVAVAQLPNVVSAIDLDVLGNWPELVAEGVCVANMLHISPPETLPALVEGVAGVLVTGGFLLVYGPFKQNGQFTSKGNAAFDESLKSRDARWGIRDVEQLIATAEEYGLGYEQTIAMPANNMSVILRRA